MKQIACFVAACVCALPSLAGGVAWEKTFSEAKVKAGLEGKLMYLDFFTDW